MGWSMKKNLFIIVILVLIILICSKGDIMKKKNYNVRRDYPFRSEYDILEIKEFFEGATTNDITIKPQKRLYVYNVDVKFPLEFLENGYTAYKIKQGGFFFVEWSLSWNEEKQQARRKVYCTTYIKENLSENAFDSIHPGISTAADVEDIDPYFIINCWMSSGVYSYSYLNKDWVMEIEYEIGYQDHTNMIVKKIQKIPRESASCIFGVISDDFLP